MRLLSGTGLAASGPELSEIQKEHPMSDRKPWQPRLDTEPEANAFANRTQGDGAFKKPLRDPEEDTAPLQGSKDISDDDSLVDVVAEQSRDPAAKP
jgi:hypothetical protein